MFSLLGVTILDYFMLIFDTECRYTPTQEAIQAGGLQSPKGLLPAHVNYHGGEWSGVEVLVAPHLPSDSSNGWEID